MSHWLTKVFTQEYDYPPLRGDPISKTVIATLPRTGSTFLCHKLWETGHFGAPAEYLNVINRDKDMIPRLGKGEFERYWQELLQRRTSPNGIFATKLFVQDISNLYARGIDAARYTAFDYVIYLRRRDRLAQALSYYRANYTNAWFANVRPQRIPEYNTDAIIKALGWIADLEASWAALFAAKECLPMTIYYEDMSDDIVGCVKKIFDFTDTDLVSASEIDIPRLTIQRDKVSEEWAKRFIKEVPHWESSRFR